MAYLRRVISSHVKCDIYNTDLRTGRDCREQTHQPCIALLAVARLMTLRTVPPVEEYEERSLSQASVFRLRALEWAASTQTERSNRETLAPASSHSGPPVSLRHSAELQTLHCQSQTAVRQVLGLGRVKGL